MSVKDKIIFCTKADHDKPSVYQLPAPLPSEERHGVVLPNGDINWTCPCLGGLPYGPCGFEFREFFKCLPQVRKDNYAGADAEQSKERDDDPSKAEECFPKFKAMKECFSQFPKLYPPDEEDV